MNETEVNLCNAHQIKFSHLSLDAPMSFTTENC